MAPARNHPALGDVIKGEKFSFRIVEPMQAGGMNNKLFKVRRLDTPSASVSLAKFFRAPICPSEQGLGDPDQRLLKRLKKEAKFLGSFNHRNIVKIIDHARDLHSEHVCGDRAFYVMEYVQGATLEHLIGNGPIQPRRALYIAQEIARGLTEVHSRRIVHRDLHPGNVLVNLDSIFNIGAVKLLDFGSAVGESITKPHVYEPHYDPIGGAFHRAPEADNPQHAVTSSDIFSLAVTLIELASATLIKTACSGVWHRDAWIERQLNSLRGHYPPAFVSLLREMVHSEPHQRPTAGTVLARLTAIKIPMNLVEKVQAGAEVAKGIGLLAVAAGIIISVTQSNGPAAASPRDQAPKSPDS